MQKCNVILNVRTVANIVQKSKVETVLARSSFSPVNGHYLLGVRGGGLIVDEVGDLTIAATRGDFYLFAER